MAQGLDRHGFGKWRTEYLQAWEAPGAAGCGGEVLRVWTHLLLLSFFLQELSLALPGHSKSHMINYPLPHHALTCWLFVTLSSPPLQINWRLIKMFKNFRALRESHLWSNGQFIVIHLIGEGEDRIVSLYFIIQSLCCPNNLQKEVLIGSFSVWEGTWIRFYKKENWSLEEWTCLGKDARLTWF